MERKGPNKGYSLPGDCQGRDKSGHGKEVTEKGVLTAWRLQREGQVRTWKESKQVRGTHSLETTEGGTCQDMQRKQLSKGHSPTGDQREGKVRTWKESNQARGTHSLETQREE